MLIRFSVENFRSFKDRQSLYLNSVKTCKEWLDENTAVESDVRIVRSAVIYGANASGKTNLFIALLRMKAFMLASVGFDKKSTYLFCEPFALSKGMDKKPVLFELEFTHDSKRFIYGFSMCMTNNSWENYAIVKEWLIEVEKNKKRPYFLRERYIGDTGNPSDVINVDGKMMPQGLGLEQRTRPDVLFFTVAAQFAEPTCQAISEYIGKAFNVYSGIEHQAFVGISKNKLATDVVMAGKIKKLVSDADTGVKDLTIDSGGNIISHHSLYDEMGDVVGQMNFSFDYMESLGTRKLFDISCILVEALQDGHVLMIDELDAKLHPLIVRRIIELFNNPTTNPKNAQLIFNAQSPDLLGYKVYSEAKGKKITRLRRDQIYFVEKDNQEASKVFSLIEFKKDSGLRTRNDASYDKDYLSGVYGGIPFPKEMVAEVSSNG